LNVNDKYFFSFENSVLKEDLKQIFVNIITESLLEFEKNSRKILLSYQNIFEKVT
jgi:hypothetical protein